MMENWDKINNEAIERLIARHRTEFIEFQELCKREFERHGDFLK